MLRTTDAIELVGNGLVTNEKTIAKDPKLVQAVVDALYAGIVETARDPEAAFEICKKFIENLDTADNSIQLTVLTESIKLWQTDKNTTSLNQRWENMQTVLLDIGLLKQPVDTSKAWTNDFID